jgi:hypothetical protein
MIIPYFFLPKWNYNIFHQLVWSSSQGDKIEILSGMSQSQVGDELFEIIQYFKYYD